MIREATKEDFGFIYELYMHPQINPWLLYEPMNRELFLPIYNDLVLKKVLFVFENENNPAGMCKLIPQQFRNEHIVYLGGVAIHPSYTGKGLGLKMLEEIKESLKQKGFLRVELSVASINKKAIRLYEKSGFVKEGILKKFTYMKKENRFLDEIMMAFLFE